MAIYIKELNMYWVCNTLEPERFHDRMLIHGEPQPRDIHGQPIKHSVEELKDMGYVGIYRQS